MLGAIVRALIVSLIAGELKATFAEVQRERVRRGSRFRIPTACMGMKTSGFENSMRAPTAPSPRSGSAEVSQAQRDKSPLRLGLNRCARLLTKLLTPTGSSERSARQEASALTSRKSFPPP